MRARHLFLLPMAGSFASSLTPLAHPRRDEMATCDITAPDLLGSEEAHEVFG